MKRERDSCGEARTTSGDEQHRARAMPLELEQAQAKCPSRGHPGSLNRSRAITT